MDSCFPEELVAAETQQALVVHAGYILEKFCRLCNCSAES